MIIIGQAHWAKVLAPPRWARVLQYLVGWYTNLAWLCISAASNQYAADFIAGLIEALLPSVVITPWQRWLVCVAVSLLCLVMNLPGAFKVLPYLSSASVVLINVTALFMVITLLVKTEHKQSASVVFVEVVNTSGWDSLGVVFFLGMLPGLSCMGALDSALHLTDEVENASKEVPQVMLGSFGLGAVSGIVMIIILGFCNVDPQSLLDSLGGMPLIQIFVNSYNSTPLVITATLLVIVCFTMASITILTSWSRLYWSLSTAELVPLHSWTRRLSGSSELPINALIINTILSNALAAIKIGNTTAMNAIQGAVKLFVSITFTISITLLLNKGRGALNPDRWLNLGRFGPLLNVVGILWSIFISVWLCFPLSLPVSAASVNYTPVVVSGFTLIAAVYYFIFYRKDG